MTVRRIAIMLELTWPLRRHLEVFSGTHRYARESGRWDCVLDEYVHEALAAPRSRLGRYDGVVARANPELAAAAARRRIPVVNVWYNSPARDALPGVFPDFDEMGRLAAEHLLSRGFRRFACLSGRGDAAHGAMLAGFHRLVEGHGEGCRCARCPTRYHAKRGTWQRFQRTLDAWIATWTPPVGVFVAFSDVTARYVANACRRRGLRIPEDVALVTAGNEPAIATMPPASLTSVSVDYERLGHRAAALLDELIEGRDRRAVRETVAPDGVIARSSTDFFAVDDEIVAAAMRFVERHAAGDIGVADVARGVNVARRTLERRFRLHTGRSVAAEIRRLRVRLAQRLLLDTDLLLKQIARQAGFRDAVRMHEVFVREVGTTPGRFRDRGIGPPEAE